MNNRLPCPLASIDEIAALCFEGTLLIVASGTKPNPCYQVHIRKSPIRVWPPHFYVEACPSSGICIQPVPEYLATGLFELGQCPETITVQGAGGPQTVPVTVLSTWELFTAEARKRLGDDAHLPDEKARAGQKALVAGSGDGSTATGYSNESLQLAFQDAVAQLDLDPPYPDALADVKIVKQGAHYGGFAGVWNRHYVEVERRWT